jgi:hypothetical protein
MRTRSNGRITVRRAVGIATGLLTAVALSVLAIPAHAATTHVDCTTDALQPAIDAASPGDTLVVDGVCQGQFVIDHDLTLEGTGTLDGMGAGTTLFVVTDSIVTIRDLTITNGWSVEAAGIANGGTLVLRGTTSVLDNAGVGIENTATLTMRGSSTVRGNTGGGIWNFGVLTMNGTSSIVGNTSTSGGGGISSLGINILNDWASVRNNQGRFYGGGLAIFDSRLELHDHASVVGNRIEGVGGAGVGGGIFARTSSVTIDGNASVRGNVSSIGGGIAADDGMVTLAGWSSVRNNRAVSGGGIHHVGAGNIRLNGHAAITGNHATLFGGGLWNGGCTSELPEPVTMLDASVIRDNVVGTTTQPGFGGGIYTFVDPVDPACGTGITNLLSGRIVRNRARGGGSGGGVFGPIATLGPDMVIRDNTPNDCDPAC